MAPINMGALLLPPSPSNRCLPLSKCESTLHDSPCRRPPPLRYVSSLSWKLSASVQFRSAAFGPGDACSARCECGKGLTLNK
ncbi:hypothetical protein GDO81_021798 [Engystomops pustulosus]|uniref:Uncharacterized protein n=1 Tax=Engystomops pustulosus TaxID=76066 RepID=A0AAV6Z6P4_ENGPU|nr:hypothetical protein GDO81_021798 [Engystomops pustulosus]